MWSALQYIALTPTIMQKDVHAPSKTWYWTCVLLSCYFRYKQFYYVKDDSSSIVLDSILVIDL